MLPEQDWLSHAQALAVGMRTRVRHGRESRVNMVVANDPEKWWAYCQKCHEGAVIQKEHVMLRNHEPPPQATLTLPTDILPLVPGSYEELTVARYLAKKCMDMQYFPHGVQYSASRKRIMVQAVGQWHGRDITDKSLSKWLNYSTHQIVQSSDCQERAVVVEDLFSWFKVLWATRGSNLSVLCALGTQDKPALISALMRFKEVLWFFDADRAGDTGAAQGMRRLAPFVQKQRRVRPSDGCDPKDMDIQFIRAALT